MRYSSQIDESLSPGSAHGLGMHVFGRQNPPTQTLRTQASSTQASSTQASSTQASSTQASSTQASSTQAPRTQALDTLAFGAATTSSWRAPTSGDSNVAPMAQGNSEAGSGLGDAKLAVVFRQIRAINELNEADMARRIGTGIDVVLSFEAGNVDALPPWPETARLIERYAALGGVDPAPLLSRILSLQTLPVIPPPRVERQPDPVQILSDALRRAPAPAQPAPPDRSTAHRRSDQSRAPQQPLPEPAVPVAAAPAASPIGFAARSRLTEEPATERPRTVQPRATEPVATPQTAARRRRRVRNTILALSPVLLLLALFVGLRAAPGTVYALAHTLPAPIGSATRGVIDVIAAQTATFKDGMRWIEVDDPRLRKAHRLPTR
jgi:hypothetical protein